MIEYKLIRSARISIGAYIRKGVVEVRAPFFYSADEIDEFVASKQEWISHNLAESKEQEIKRNNFSLTYGSEITYRGSVYTISGELNRKSGFVDTSLYVPPNLSPEQIRLHCINLLKMHAEVLFEKIACECVGKMLVLPSDFNISNATRSWGRCSSKKSIRISWLLIMADDDLIEYVIVHELAHLIEFNHSAQFWTIVEHYIPDYKNRKARLRLLQEKLMFENWDA